MDSENILAYVNSLDASIAGLREALTPVLRLPLQDSISDCASNKEKVKLYHAHLYTVISVLFAYLKVLGIKTEDHPIMKDLTKIQGAMKAMKQLETASERKDQKEEAAQQATAAYVQRALGMNGGGAAPDSMMQPAISSAHFTGTHTKFSDDEAADEAGKPAVAAKGKPAAPAKPKPAKAAKVTKPAAKPTRAQKKGKA